MCAHGFAKGWVRARVRACGYACQSASVRVCHPLVRESACALVWLSWPRSRPFFINHLTNLIFFSPDDQNTRRPLSSPQVGVVTQEPTLFQATVLDNIRCAHPAATEEDVVRAGAVLQGTAGLGARAIASP